LSSADVETVIHTREIVFHGCGNGLSHVRAS
jgi:hypothetical protein